MTGGNYYPPAGPPAPEKKPSLWQRFKRWPLIAKVATIGCGGLVLIFGGLLVLGMILWAVNPDGMQEIVDEQEQERLDREAEEQAEAEAEREVEEQAAREAEEAEDEDPEEEPGDQVEVPDVDGMIASEARDELDDLGLDVEYVADGGSVWNPDNWEVSSTDPAAGKRVDEDSEIILNVVRPEEPDPFDGMEIPEGINDQIADMTVLDALEDAEVSFHEGDENWPYTTVYVDMEVEIGLTIGTTCRAAQQATIDGLEFMRDRVPADYDRVMFSFHVRGDADATGSQPIIGLASASYDRETVESIDSDSVNTQNVWQARDDGSTSQECQ